MEKREEARRKIKRTEENEWKEGHKIAKEKDKDSNKNWKGIQNGRKVQVLSDLFNQLNQLNYSKWCLTSVTIIKGEQKHTVSKFTSPILIET